MLKLPLKYLIKQLMNWVDWMDAEAQDEEPPPPPEILTVESAHSPPARRERRHFAGYTRWTPPSLRTIWIAL
jgi:hypothetical protein